MLLKKIARLWSNKLNNTLQLNCPVSSIIKKKMVAYPTQLKDVASSKMLADDILNCLRN